MNSPCQSLQTDLQSNETGSRRARPEKAGVAVVLEGLDAHLAGILAQQAESLVVGVEQVADAREEPEAVGDLPAAMQVDQVVVVDHVQRVGFITAHCLFAKVLTFNTF